MTEEEEIKKHFGLVATIIKSFSPKDEAETNDYIQEGNIALLKAIRKHDAKRGKISTLAWTYITKALIRYYKTQQKIREKQTKLLDTIPAKEPINLWEVLPDNLSSMEKDIIQMKSEGYSFKDIGIKLGYNKCWISQTYKSAIGKIQEANG